MICTPTRDWSDGGSPIEEMARAGAALGHEYMVLTDHSPRLKVANGLSAERLRRQLDVVAEVNAELAPFRLLTGIEVDILEDGTLDQDPDLLAELDVVVASVHSKLRMPAEQMTPRMVRAIANPHVDVLGHCTGRIVVGKGAAGVGVRRGDRLRRLRSGSGWRSRSTHVPSGSIRRNGCYGWPWRPAATSASTPTPTLPASSIGSPTAASAPRRAASPPKRSSTPGPVDDLLAWAGPSARLVAE